MSPQTSPPEGGTTNAGSLAPLPGIDPLRQNELYHLAKISERLETVVALLAFIMVASFVTALLLFLRR